MAKKTDELVPVTSEDVAQAWRDVEAAKAAVADLRHRFVTGDDSVTQTEIQSQQGVVEWLELVAHRVQNQRERYEAAYAVAARKDLKAEILATATGNGDEILALVDQVHAAASELVAKANEHNAQVRRWRASATDLQVPDKGAISAAHEGLGTSAAGTVLVDDVRVGIVEPRNLLGHLFHAEPNMNGIVPFPAGSADVAAARRIAANMGKAVV